MTKVRSRMLSVLLALCMVLTLTPGLGIPARAAETGQSYQIYVEISTDKTITLTITPDDTIESVKGQIEEIEGIPKEQQTLMFIGKTLVDDRTISAYNIQKEATLYLLSIDYGNWTDEGVRAEGFSESDISSHSITIMNAAELGLLAYMLMDKPDCLDGYTITLGDDIDLTGKYWTPMPMYGGELGFTTFDGNGKTISGLTVKDFGSAEAYVNDTAYVKRTTVSSAGLFSDLNKARVTNLVISAPEISVAGMLHWDFYLVGSISGHAENTRIINCEVVNPSVELTTAYGYSGIAVGGLLGYAGQQSLLYKSTVSGGSVEVIVTECESNEIQLGGVVGYMYDAMAEDVIADEKGKIEAIADGQTIALYLDLSVLKSRFDSLGTPLGKVTQLTELQSLLTITFELPEALRGQNNLAVYRVHGDTASALPKGAANAVGGEYFDISDNIVTLVVNKFSTYAIGYTPQSNNKPGGSGGGTVIAQPIITMPKDPEGGSAKLSTDRKTVTFTPDEGWEIADVTIDGKSVGAVESYTFTDSKNHTVGVTFRKIETDDSHLCDAFADIKTHWAFGDICYVVENRLFNGTSTTLFSPDTPMNRGMIVTVLWRLEGEPEAAASEPFADVLPGAYYHDAVAWASETDGIVLGYGDGRFGPDDDLTREQIAAILWRYAKYKDMDVSVGEDTNILSYNDALDVSEYAIPAMQWACGEGIITGKPGNLLDPLGKATRAEVAAMLHRLLAE